MVVSSEEIPLNPTNSETKTRPNQSIESSSCYDTSVDDAERRLLNVNQRPAVDCTRLRTIPQQESAFHSGQNGKTLSPLDMSQQDKVHSGSNLRDINAMSVASIYDREHNEIMDADNDIYNDVSFSKPHARASRERDSVYELNIVPETSDMGTKKYHNADCESCYSEPPEPTTSVPNSQYDSLFFADGERSIDFVIVWQPVEDRLQEELNCIKRAIFEDNLVNEGLELERDEIEHLHFTKIHTPIEVLRRYSEILKLRMPMKESLCSVQEQNRFSKISNAALYISNKIPGFRSVQNTTTSAYDRFSGCCNKLWNLMSVDEQHFPPKSTRFTAVYSRDKEYLFDVHHKCFFTPAIRSRIVQFILDRKRFTMQIDDDYAFGIDRLINEGVYIASYPLHDGEISVPGSVRHLLYKEWASVSKWYRYQPLDYVKDYFGVKIGLYFAWLGYYTYMLLLASIVGIGCFLYAIFTLPYDIPSQEICYGNMKNTTMCPLCDRLCNYWSLEKSCLHIKVTYLFDNKATVFFAVFMSFWATLFLELWKRYSAEITHRWDLTGFDIHEEHPRPQYLARLAHVKKVRIDYITNTKEPDPPFWRMKLPAAVFSFSIVILLVALALAAVVAVVIYRMSFLAALSVSTDNFTTSNAIYITTITAALINLSLIFAFSWLYIWLAEWLTEYEILRTQTEFDDSLTLKIYLFQFVNYYASIFYIAFFKGKFIGRPGDYNRFLGYRQEECGFGGCITELCIQLAIIMIGKQAMNTVLEMIQPRIFKYYNSLRVRLSKRKKSTSAEKDAQRWLRDLKLVEWGPQSLFNEYLEMVLQYGFVTIFVAAFPLAPFFALLNNILEMRFDAQKLLKFHRRPVTQRVRDIGVWYRILDSIGKLSVITNGFIIAFTSEFIPRFIYQLFKSEDRTLTGYVNYSLSVFDTRNFTAKEVPSNPTNPTNGECRYADFRYGPGENHEYDVTYAYWVILAARLGFVVLFENFVAVVMIWVRWAIPDMSAELRDKIRREAYITNEIIIKQEAERARKLSNVVIAERMGDDIEPDAGILKAEKLMSSNLCGSQLDLFMHGEGDPFAPGHAVIKQNENSAHDNEMNKMFLESEKIAYKRSSKNDPTDSIDNESGEAMTETSAL
ncbi:anoctamin-1 isoform X2 [Contarinia nasturtii]|uniref:anoctamin-1 isoform X2 n=1 Tax=Contarinia nasturtii TaxID=265458 RepID=UPI0012D3801D|nr:anoctamin-1 isoform X2 [Contarinia nasturtii]